MVHQSTHKSFLTESDRTISRQVDRDMRAELTGTIFSETEKIALACRILADHGHAQTLAGQITVRADDASYWTTGFGAGFAESSVSNLVRVDHEMKVVEGKGMANPGVRFHLWIYERRRDLNSIVHTHPPHCSALGMIGEPLAIAHMDSAMFFENCALLEYWPGLPLYNEEGRIISEALGDRRALLMVNHGMLTVGASLEEAMYLAVLMEHAARVQLAALATGKPIRSLDPKLALPAKEFLLKQSFTGATFNYWARQAARRHPQALN